MAVHSLAGGCFLPILRSCSGVALPCRMRTVVSALLTEHSACPASVDLEAEHMPASGKRGQKGDLQRRASNSKPTKSKTAALASGLNWSLVRAGGTS